MKQILCFGDSNTWGYDPKSGKRFAWGIRWTSIVQEELGFDKYHVIEEGLCGRTTVFEDELRAGRRGAPRRGSLSCGTQQQQIDLCNRLHSSD